MVVRILNLNICCYNVKFKKSQCSESEETSNDSPSQKNADQVVKSLLKARLVYRIFNDPIGKIETTAAQMYSVRGFFLSSNEKQYRFLTQKPLRQFWRIDPEVLQTIHFNLHF